MLDVVYHNTVFSIRKSHRNAFIGLLLNIMQTAILVVALYVMIWLMGPRLSLVRGDFLLFILSGIFLFMVHIKAIGAVAGAGGSVSAMMQHAPMNTLISISSAALGSLYIQVLSLLVILFIYHVGFTPITIHQPIAAFGMLLIAWFSGIAIGLIFLALQPWLPGVTDIGRTIYTRINMLASGKMFLANNLPSNRRALFDWNPLFHTIDQARGYTFLNYTPHFTSITYPIMLSLALIMIGLIGEFYTRKHVSLSWTAGR